MPTFLLTWALSHFGTILPPMMRRRALSCKHFAVALCCGRSLFPPPPRALRTIVRPADGCSSKFWARWGNHLGCRRFSPAGKREVRDGLATLVGARPTMISQTRFTVYRADHISQHHRGQQASQSENLNTMDRPEWPLVKTSIFARSAFPVTAAV